MNHKDFHTSMLTRMLQHEQRRRQLAEDALAAERSAYEHLRGLVSQVHERLAQCDAAAEEPKEAQPDEALANNWPDMAVALGLPSGASADAMLHAVHHLQGVEAAHERLMSGLIEVCGLPAGIYEPADLEQEVRVRISTGAAPNDGSKVWHKRPKDGKRPATLSPIQDVYAKTADGRVEGPVEARLVMWGNHSLRYWREA